MLRGPRCGSMRLHGWQLALPSTSEVVPRHISSPQRLHGTSGLLGMLISKGYGKARHLGCRTPPVLEDQWRMLTSADASTAVIAHLRIIAASTDNEPCREPLAYPSAPESRGTSGAQEVEKQR